MNICALVISILAFALSVFQFVRDSSRQKKEATLIAYNELQDDVFSYISEYSYPMPEIKRGGEEWHKLTVCLAKLERFSVGVNTGVYSMKILNSIGGAYFIREFEKMEPIIKVKRKNNIIPCGHYDQFEKTVKRLKDYRNAKNWIKRISLTIRWIFDLSY